MIKDNDELIYYSQENVEKFPSEFINIIISGATITLCGMKLHTLFEDIDKNLEYENIRKWELNSYTHDEFRLKNIPTLRDKKSAYIACHYLCQNYKSEPHNERKTIRTKFRSSYIHDFEIMLAEYESAGEKLTDPSIYDSFIGNLPQNKYSTYKLLFKESSLRNLYNIFE